MIPLINSFYAGLFFLIAGSCGLIRHFLLEPSMPNFPRAPGWLLKVFFVFATMLMFFGMRYLWAWASGTGTTIPPGASNMMVVVSATIMFYKGCLLYNIASQRYPVETWLRLNRVAELARCANKRRGS